MNIRLSIIGLFLLSSCIMQAQYSSFTFGSMRAREIGPATSSGRVTAVQAVRVPLLARQQRKGLSFM